MWWWWQDSLDPCTYAETADAVKSVSINEGRGIMVEKTLGMMCTSPCMFVSAVR